MNSLRQGCGAGAGARSLEWKEVLESRAGAEPEPVILKSRSWSHRFYC